MSTISHFQPLHLSLTVAESKIHGLGVIAKEDIAAQTDLGISHVKSTGYKDNLIRTPLGGFLNHSDDPNARYNIKGNDFRLVTSRPIKKGEEVTVSYRGYYADRTLDSFG